LVRKLSKTFNAGELKMVNILTLTNPSLSCQSMVKAVNPHKLTSGKDDFKGMIQWMI
jgi:hypothetical protein